METDRARFLGRGHGIHRPIAVIDGRPLSNTVGTVLDPVFALRRRVRIAPGAIVRIAFWTVVAESRAEVLDLVDKHRDATAFERAGHAGLDPGAGAAPSSRHRSGRGRAVPAARRPSSACRTDAAAVFRHHPPWCRRAAGAVAHEHFRRPADCAAAHCRCRISRSRAAIAAGARILADEAACGRSGDPERACVVLRAGSAERAGDAGAREPVVRCRTAWSAGTAASSCCGPICLRRRPVRCSLSVARVVLVGQRGSLADQLDRVPEPKEAERITRKRAVAERGTAHRATTAGSGVLQRARRFRGQRAGICHDPRARPVHAGTLDQCHRQSRFRLPGVGRGQRLHLVGQQPREPTHALVERSGQRSPGRGVLSARRRYRRPVEPDGAADPRPQRRLCGAAWLGLQPVRAFGARHHRRAAAVRAAGQTRSRSRA